MFCRSGGGAKSWRVEEIRLCITVAAKQNVTPPKDLTLSGNPTFVILAEMWRRSAARDPLKVAVDRGKATSFSNESINGGDVADALNFLADMTGDEAFLAGKLTPL